LVGTVWAKPPAQSTKKGGGPFAAIKATSVAVEIASENRMHHWVSHGKWYSETYGKYYKPGYYGNQYQPSSIIRADKTMAISRFGRLQVVSRGAFATGTGISLIKGYSAYSKGDYEGVGKSGLDLYMGGVTMLGGPPGQITGGIYFGVDATIGWGEALRLNKQAHDNYREATGGRILQVDMKTLQ